VQPIVLYDLVQIQSPQEVLTSPAKEKYITHHQTSHSNIFTECVNAQDICAAFKVCFVSWYVTKGLM
jgi:hypothetical protein